jgi:hypothetical protein
MSIICFNGYFTKREQERYYIIGEVGALSLSGKGD